MPDSFFEEGFTDQTDLFGHRDLAERLTYLFGSLEQGTVSILDGRWGIGKTVFARQWAHHLRQSNIPSIYFDAFAADYIEQPFQAISAALIKAAVDARKQDSPVYQRFLSNAASAAKKIGGAAAKLGTKVVTLGLIGAAEIDQLTEIADDIASATGDVSEEAVKALLEEQADSEATFAELRKSLDELPGLLAIDADGESAPNRLVVIIDELDRCRPDFALGILETLKHFFHADRVHFVLVTNRQHLILSVKKRYGAGDAADEYIQKFYDFIIHLESKLEPHKGTLAKLYVGHVLNRLIPSHVSNNNRSDIFRYVQAICIAYDLSLRQAERIATNVVLSFLANRGEQSYRPVPIIAFLCAVKAMRPEIFQSAKTGRFRTDAFRSFIGEGNWSGTLNIQGIIDLFEYYGNPTVNREDPRYENYGKTMPQFHFSDYADILPYVANAIVDRFGKE